MWIVLLPFDLKKCNSKVRRKPSQHSLFQVCAAVDIPSLEALLLSVLHSMVPHTVITYRKKTPVTRNRYELSRLSTDWLLLIWARMVNDKPNAFFLSTEKYPFHKQMEHYRERKVDLDHCGNCKSLYFHVVKRSCVVTAEANWSLLIFYTGEKWALD